VIREHVWDWFTRIYWERSGGLLNTNTHTEVNPEETATAHIGTDC